MTFNQPAIAVVVPTYNHADYLIETLQAIYAQTYLPKRVIVVDDGSTDHTLRKIEEFKIHNPALEIIQQSNAGPAAARNKGIHAADDCEWIAFCDSDDIWHPEKLSEQVRVLQNTTLKNLGCVYCINGIIDETGVILEGHGKPGPYNLSMDQIKNGIIPSGSMSSVMIRRDLLLSVNGFDENLQSDEDLELMIRLSPSCIFDFTTRILTYIRIHSTKISNNTARLYKSKNYILNKHSDFFDIEGTQIRWLRYDIFRNILDAQKWHELSNAEKIQRFPVLLNSYISIVWTHFDGKGRALLFPLLPTAILLVFFDSIKFSIRKIDHLSRKIFSNDKR